MSLDTSSSARPPVAPPSQSFETYIAFRQCIDGQTDYFSLLEQNDDHAYRVYLESSLMSDEQDRTAFLLRVPLGKAVSAGAAILKLSEEQSLVSTAEFNIKLQKLLRVEYEIAAKNVQQDDIENIPAFPLEERRLISTLLRGPNGRRAVEQVRQYLLPESDS
jgi:hypothetical protein